MKKIALILPLLLAITGCSMEDPETGEKTSLGKAAEHTKEAAKNLGNAVSESASNIDEKWTEMNKNRVETRSGEDTSYPVEQAQGDTEAMKDSLAKTRDKVVDASKAAVDKVKSIGDDNKTETKE